MFEIGTDEQVDNTYGWCREGVTLQKDILQGVPLSSIDWWMLVFSRDEVILIRDLDDIRLQYPMVYAMLKPQDVTTLAAGPVTSEGKVIGFLGVDNPNREMMGMLAPIINVSGRFVDACHEMGIGIALDDFGSGYSSLRMLLQYPSSIIKLDRSLLLEMAASEDKMNFLSSIVYACLRYFQLRDPEGTLALLSPNFINVGTGDGEVAANKEQFRRLLRDELQAVPWPLSHKLDNYTQHQRATTCWDCFCDVHIGLEQPEYGIQVTYHIRLTAGFHLEGERWFIDTMHAFEASHTQEEGEFFPLSFALQGTSQINRNTQKELIEILAQLMPGGVVGGYVEDGFPLYVANDRMLQMAGYQSYEEFSRQIQGLVINSIHPDDREFSELYRTADQVLYEVKNAGKGAVLIRPL